MEVKQIYEITNDIVKELLGKEDLLKEDLTNIVDVGTELFNAHSVDKYVGALVNRIGKVIFVNRVYRGSAPSVLMDKWEFGSVVQKIRSEMPQATENESWELEDGASYDQDIFYKPIVSAKFYNNKTTFEVPMSFTERQVKQSFDSATQLNAFLSMLYNEVDKAMTVRTDSLIMRTINNFAACTVKDSYGTAQLSSKSTVRAVNLLYLYNQDHSGSTPLTADEAIKNKEFLRFASLKMGIYKDRMSKMSTLFNTGGKERFTPEDMLHVILLSEFEKSAAAYLQSDTYHDAYVKLPKAETVPFWQGTGKDYEFESTSQIKVKTTAGDDVTVTGIIGVMFDRDALGVTNLDRRVTTHYNAKAEFYTNWYKFDAGYFNDFNENFVVFFVA